MSLPNYDDMTREQLITRLIELEEIVCPPEAQDLIAKIPFQMGQRQREILAMIYAASPKYVSTTALITAVYGDIEADRTNSLKVLVSKTRQLLKGWEIKITSAYGRGYKMSREDALKLKERILGEKS